MTSHVTIDDLAAYVAGELDAAGAVTVEAHVLLCADCREDAEALRTTFGELISLPPVTMPVDVAARIDAALDAERRGTVVRLDSRRPANRLAGLSVAAVTVTMLVAVGIGVSQRVGGRDSGTAARGPVDAPLPAEYVYASGFDYDTASLIARVHGLVGGSFPESAPNMAAAPGQAYGGPSGPAETSTKTSLDTLARTDARVDDRYALVVPGPLERLRNPAALTACLDALRAGGPAVEPIALDYARYDGKPALIVVFPRDGDADQVDVWVVEPGCAADDAKVLDFRRVKTSG